MIDLEALRAPFPPHVHKWRAQGLTKDGNRAQALCYIDARIVQNRLDEVCTPAGWESAFAETASGRVIATITIDMGGRWTSKSDGAGATAMEGEKGGLSDAFKRAAVMWGIGRYLYDLPAIWAECEAARQDDGTLSLRNGKPQFRRWSARGIDQLEDALAKLFAKMRGEEPAAPHVVTGRRAQELLPAPERPPFPMTGAPAFKQPPIVATILNGLVPAMASGTADRFWAEHWRQVPQEWRTFVMAEKERIVREAGH